jgi:PAS domain S-box-containing protein
VVLRRPSPKVDRKAWPPTGLSRARLPWFGADALLGLLLTSLLCLPLVMLQSLSGATVAQMELQAEEISTLASGIRAYYADNVIDRLQAANGKAVYSENYRDIHGGIPIPATLSIELGALFDNSHTDGRITYEFLSDYPFAQRASRPLDGFEMEALKEFRSDPDRQSFTKLVGNGLGASTYRLATPILMRNACVTCHNVHPDSPKRDWKVGDVRGIQEVTVRGLRVDGFGEFGWMFGYVGLLGITSVAATVAFKNQSGKLERLNRRLLESSQRESNLLARMADQVQELSIFGGVVDNSIVGISIADMRQKDQPLIYVNEAFSLVTGYSKELALGYNCRFLQGLDTDPVEIQRIREAISAGDSYSGELLNYRLDGTRFWNRLTLYPVRSSKEPGAKPDFYVANQIDISPLKNNAFTSASMHSFEQVLAGLEDALGDAVALADGRGFGFLEGEGDPGLDQGNGHGGLNRAGHDASERLLQALRAVQKWMDDRGVAT